MLQCKNNFIYCEKAGNSETENEDAYLIPSQKGIEEENILKFAVSDGATESSFSKEWADLLVSYFKDFSFEETAFEKTIQLARKSWQEKIEKIELPWYAQQKLESGAYSSFLGLTIDLENHFWEAIAIGDSNLFLIRNEKIIKSFPLEKSEQFGSTPYLLASLQTQNVEVNNFLKKEKGEINKGDVLILGTDAISSWMLSEYEKENQPWHSLKNLLGGNGYTQTDFKNWLNNKRNEKEIKNDDTTLIIIEFS